jgi:GNAT superfamily N-acetyltransferase
MQITLRPARDEDYDYCSRLYFSEMADIIRELNLDVTRQAASFRNQWDVAQVRMIELGGKDVGWLQTSDRDGELFLGQLFIDGLFQNRGIGTEVMKMVIQEAETARKPVTLDVVKINPARRLYERLGFSITGGEDTKFYMRRDSTSSGSLET